jgi:hypothetical protein
MDLHVPNALCNVRKMKKYLLAALLVTSQSYAFEYNCFSTDENEPYGISKIGLKTNKKTVVMKLDGFDNKETYSVSDYTPRTTPKRPMMKLSLVGSGNNSYGESPLYEFFGDQALMTGGYELRDGQLGGFIKVTGWGYSWANYLCVRK